MRKGTQLALAVIFLSSSCSKDSGRPVVPKTLPELTTNEVTEIRLDSAKSGGLITSDGGVSVTGRGVCWSVNPSPTIEDNKTVDGSGGGSFVSVITGLLANTAYYLRAYATTANGTAYGLSYSFTTKNGAISISTTAVTEILTSSAKSGGSVTDDGGAAVSARGVCWSVNSSPTINDNKTIDGAGVGSFTSSITGLVANTNYFVRAYAINSAGTSYGVAYSFKPGVFDPDNNSYSLVTIGSQVWIKENLKTSKYQNGDAITGWSNYNNDPQYDAAYGKLYDFATVADSRKVCPVGYHVASQSDWEALFTFLGGVDVAGGKMKEAGTTHWADPNTGADNSSGFTALPGGRRADDGTYAALTLNAIWWSSTDFPSTPNALYYSLFNSTTTTFNSGISRNYQMSVRCLKD